MTQRCVRIAVVVGLVLTGGLTGFGSASASPAATADAQAATIATITLTPLATGGAERAAAGTITCTLDARQRPHHSTHVRGTINVVETASCTAPVPQLTITPYLHPPIPYATIVGRRAVGTVEVSSNAATTYCASGNYGGSATMTVTAPPGYQPPTVTRTAYGPTVSITCP